MTDHQANTKFLEIAKLLGLETEYFCGNFKVRLNGKFIGQMCAEMWLDRLRNCMNQVQR